MDIGSTQFRPGRRNPVLADRRGRWSSRLVAAPLVAVMVLTLAEQPVVARPPQEWEPPAPPDVEGVAVVDLPAGEPPVVHTAALAASGSLPVVWPRPEVARVSVPSDPAAAGVARADGAPPLDRPGRARAGGLPVRVGAAPLSQTQARLAAAGMADVVPVPGRVAVQVMAEQAARSAGHSGLLLGVARADGVRRSGSVAVEVDYSGFRYAYGGDWASRLRVVALGTCDDHSGGCESSAVLPTANDHQGGVLAATVPLSSDGGYTMLAVAAAPEGDNGDYKATGLSPAGTWQVSEQTGAFGWSYPLRMVPGVAGPEPSLALSYSSQSADGQTVNTNGQGSWIGDGWELWPGYIERTYQQCGADEDPVGGQDPNNKDKQSGDQCWVNDNASLSLNGQVTELVKDGANRFRGVDDDGTRVERLFDTSLGNGTYNGEYWKVTTVDGTRYMFGRHRRQGYPTDTAATNSTWTTPVYGNHPGEPCHESGDFAGSRCTQAWRWNLDYVIDPHGNSMTLFYAREMGAYGREADPDKRTTYHRGGYLTRVEYGTRAGAEHTQIAPARLVFDVADRCVPGQTCSQSNPQAWPDTPWDQYCTSAPCNEQLAVTFWTQKRLATVTAQVRRGGAWSDVESWTLRHDYLDAGAADGEGVPMWLSGLTRTGHVTQAGGSMVSDPEIVFDPGSLPLANRVDGPTDGKTKLNRWRLHRIWTESGGIVNVSYSPPECTRSDPPTPHTNTKRCYPQWYGVGDADPTLDWFHKYVTTQVTIEDVTGASTRMETHYEYLDSPAWHYHDSPLIEKKKRTWSQWRGYSKVRVREGVASEQQSAVEYLYLRGMHGDRATPSGGAKNVQITDSQQVSITDHEAHAGFLREQTTLDGPDGQWVEGTINTPWQHGPVATSGPLKAYLTGTEQTRTRTRLEDGGTRWIRTITTFDTTYAMPVTVEDRGDEAIGTDDTCTRYTYARNTGAWIVDRVSRNETVEVRCDQTPSRPGDVLTDERIFYDNPDTFGATPTRGLPVKEQEVGSWNGSTPVWVTTARTAYDIHGRPVEEYDALDRKTTTSYAPSTGGPVTQLVVTNPMGHQRTDTLEPGWGLPVRVADANGGIAELTYDGAGRLTQVWTPGRDRATETPTMKFSYLLRKDAPSAVTTQTLLPLGDSYRTSISLYDGLLRERQTQSQAPGGGRVISDQVYDSRGLLEWESVPYYDSTNAPPSTTLVGAGMPQIPGLTEYVYDGAGRVLHEIFKDRGQVAWRTSHAYGGDRTHVTPPAGGTATTTITDAHGNTTALRQYHGPTPAGTYDETRYTYTIRGELASVTDPAGNTWTYTYDQRGRRTTVADPDLGTMVSTYDAAGQLLTEGDGRGVVVGYTYDQLGRRTSARDGSPSGPTQIEWVYDTLPGGVGELTRSIRHHGGNQYVNEVMGYTEAGLPTGTRTVIPPSETGLGGTYETTHTYHPDGSLATTTLPAAGDLAAEQLTTAYDDIGAPTWLVSPLTVYVGAVYYSKLGDITQRRLGNFGKRTVISYAWDDATRRLTNASAMYETPSGPVEVSDLQYTYDPAGNLTRVADSPGRSTPNDTQCFRYDQLRRMTDAWTPLSTAADNCDANPGPIGGPAPYRLAWTYDATGNRLTQQRLGPGGGATTYSHPPPGSPRPHAVTQAETSSVVGTRLSTFAYDDGGNMTERTVNGNTQTLTWNAEGLVASIDDESDGVTEFVYDAEGQRLIRRDPDGTTLYLPGGTELRYDRGTGEQTCTRYYDHVGTTVAVRTAGGLSWMVNDHHGTGEVAIADDTMQAQHRRTLPFGEVRGPAPTAWPGDKGFVAGTQDPTGLTHLGARLYDQTLGRFISIDPVIDTSDPQQMHGYAYSNNNPVTFTDPDGLFLGWAKKKIGQAVSAVGDAIKKDPWKLAATVAGGVAAAVAVGAICATGVGCAILAGAAAGAAAGGTGYGIDVGRGDRRFSVRDLATEVGVGAVTGAATAGVAGAVGRQAANVVRGGTRSSVVRNSASCSLRNSFVAGTPVVTADGTPQPIEDLRVGDRVLATDPASGQTTAEEVVATITGRGEKVLVDIAIDAGTDPAGGGPVSVTATAGHPFWVPELDRWLPAAALRAGQTLLTTTGERVTVTAVERRQERATVYNLTVDNVHTYYVRVGDSEVLTHNCGRKAPRRLSGRLKEWLRKKAEEPRVHTADHPGQDLAGGFSRVGQTIGRLFDARYGPSGGESIGQAAGWAIGRGVSSVVKRITTRRSRHSTVGATFLYGGWRATPAPRRTATPTKRSTSTSGTSYRPKPRIGGVSYFSTYVGRPVPAIRYRGGQI